MQLIEYSAQSNDLAAPFEMQTTTHPERTLAQRSFQLPLKTKVLAPCKHEVHVCYREETQNVKLLHNGKPASNEIPHFSQRVYKIHCAEMQLIACSAQSNDLAAPLKCRQLHIQREY